MTVSATPHPAPRLPWVMTCEPDSALSDTLGPAFELTEMRIAVVPRGIVPLTWQPPIGPLTADMPGLAKTELVPATVSGALKSTTAIAIAVSATPMASAARTPGAVRVVDRVGGSGMEGAYLLGGIVRRAASVRLLEPTLLAGALDPSGAPHSTMVRPAQLAQLVEDFHGKEGVSGASPELGFTTGLQLGGL